MQFFKSSKFFVVMLMLVVIVAMAGCAGSDGSSGANGANGTNGTNGTDGTDGTNGGRTATDEGCMLCHSTGKIADIATYHPEVTAQLVISAIQVSSSATGTPVVTFHVDTDTNGVLASYTTLTHSQVRAYIADLVPADTVTSPTGTLVSNLTGTLSTAYFEQWAYDSLSSTKPLTNLGSGDYSYTFSKKWGVATSSALNIADIDVTVDTGHTQRVVLRAAPLSGDIALYGTAATGDFKVPANSTDATMLADQRLLTTIDTCQKCHTTKMLGAAHASSYMDTKACVICHSPLYGTTGDPAGFMAELQADLPEFIHKIHAAKAVSGFPTRINGNGYVDVTFPQDVKKCSICHTGVGDMGTNYKTHPTRIACGSCHTTADFANGTSFVGLDGVTKTHDVVDTDDCSGCHTATGAANNRDIVTAHDTTPTGANVPEYDVTLTLSDPAVGTFYEAGEDVTITATLNNHGGSAVSGTTYTTAKASAGTTGGGLSTASLYVYGPRANAMPLTGTQANSLFTSTTNTRITTDATGFRYVLTIPEDAADGTYMVRFRAGDYGRVDDTDYKIESIAFQTIQIGTDTVESKIDGNACTDCHGTNTTAPFHDARHAVVFDSDQCVSCHDRSGGHADPLANRVHAVHAQSVLGDLLGIDWSAITYSLGPMSKSTSASTLGASKGAMICITCHTSGSAIYKTSAIGEACVGCHNDSTWANEHMLDNGGPERTAE